MATDFDRTEWQYAVTIDSRDPGIREQLDAVLLNLSGASDYDTRITVFNENGDAITVIENNEIIEGGS